MREKGKIEKMRDVTKAGRESERVGLDTVVSVYTKLITRTSNECRWLLVGKYPPLAISTSVNNCYIKKATERNPPFLGRGWVIKKKHPGNKLKHT